jgi:hypothetical protein
MTNDESGMISDELNNKFEIPMTEAKAFDYLISRPCFEFMFLVIGYYLLFGICNLSFSVYPG